MQSGIELMIYGMGTVFVFLTLLVLVTMVMSAIVQRIAPPPVEVDSPAITPARSDDKQLIAVISAAVHKYRSRHK